MLKKPQTRNQADTFEMNWLTSIFSNLFMHTCAEYSINFNFLPTSSYSREVYVFSKEKLTSFVKQK